MDNKGVKVGLVGIYELKDHLGREQQLKDNIAKVKADGAELTRPFPNNGGQLLMDGGKYRV